MRVEWVNILLKGFADQKKIESGVSVTITELQMNSWKNYLYKI